MAVPWHRLLKVGLREVFNGTCYEVHDEFDLSDQVQRLDFAVIRRTDGELPEPKTETLPDGLQGLHDHNLISYKSMHEAFDRFALMEFTGHVVTYSKLQAKDDWRKFSQTLGLFAISTRKPSTGVIAELLQKTDTEAVYRIESQGLEITCVVINQASKAVHNWLWYMLQGDKTRWQSASITAMLKEITNRLKQMGKLDPEVEAFENQLLESWAEELGPDKMSRTSVGQALIDSNSREIARNMLKAGIPVDQVADLTGLPLEVVKELQA